MVEVSKNLQLVEAELPDDDLICLVETKDYPILLPDDIKYVDAQPKSIKPEKYPWGAKLVFRCRVYDPEEYRGLYLKMYVRTLKRWGNNPPTRAKLKKLAVLFCTNERFVRSAFLNSLFRCRVVKTKTDAPYSVIQMLEERLAKK